MKIGLLHSIKQFWGNDFNAKIYRIMYPDWKANEDKWLNFYYGLHTDRRILRGLIYNYRTYQEEFQDISDYDLIALSLNFDTYPEDFHKFVTAVIRDLFKNFPILYQKEVIILAGNEVFEKRRSVEKVIQTTWDTAQGIKNSMINLPICCWNQKIYTSGEKEAFTTLLSNELIGQICKYVGFQSLGTKACDLATYIRYIKNMGYEPVDVELGHQSDKLASSEKLFKIDKDNGVEKVFLLCPKITKQCADFNSLLGNCALSIDEDYKEKYELIKYIQQYKDKKEEVINEMLDDIIFNRLYKEGSKGIGVIRIQRILNLWADAYYIPNITKDLETKGIYDTATKNRVIKFQEATGLLVDGKAGKQTMTELLKFLLDRVEYYK